MVIMRRQKENGEDDRLEDFVRALTDSLKSDRIMDWKRYLVLPMAMYTSDRVRVIEKFEQFQNVAWDFWAKLRQRGVTSVNIRILDRMLTGDDRRVATVHYTNLDAKGNLVFEQYVRYFLLKDDDAFKIEMMEHIETRHAPTRTTAKLH